MYHPTTRLLTVLELLQAHPQLSGAELAARLEVDRRSVRRYIAMLQDMGIPVEASRGNHGGYRLRPGYKLPPLMLSDAEALAITISLEAARRQGIAVENHAVEGAIAKIERVLPNALRTELQAIRSAVTSAPFPQTPQPQAAVLRAAGAAVTGRERVRLSYTDAAGDASEREVDPYGLVSHWGSWYLVGWCWLRDDLRIFRLDRVTRVAPTGTSFTRPPDVDALQVVLERLALTPRAWLVDVLLETSMEAAERQVVPGTALLEAVSGGVRLRSTADSLDTAAQVLAGFGCRIQIRQPPELRAALYRLARTLRATVGPHDTAHTTTDEM